MAADQFRFRITQNLQARRIDKGYAPLGVQAVDPFPGGIQDQLVLPMQPGELLFRGMTLQNLPLQQEIGILQIDGPLPNPLLQLMVGRGQFPLRFQTQDDFLFQGSEGDTAQGEPEDNPGDGREEKRGNPQLPVEFAQEAIHLAGRRLHPQGQQVLALKKELLFHQKSPCSFAGAAEGNQLPALCINGGQTHHLLVILAPALDKAVYPDVIIFEERLKKIGRHELQIAAGLILRPGKQERLLMAANNGIAHHHEKKQDGHERHDRLVVSALLWS